MSNGCLLKRIKDIGELTVYERTSRPSGVARYAAFDQQGKLVKESGKYSVVVKYCRTIRDQSK
jgi:hypothetical protein